MYSHLYLSTYLQFQGSSVLPIDSTSHLVSFPFWVKKFFERISCNADLLGINPKFLLIWNYLYFTIIFIGYFFPDIEFWIDGNPLPHSKFNSKKYNSLVLKPSLFLNHIPSPAHLICITSFSLTAFKIFSFSLVFNSLIMIFLVWISFYISSLSFARLLE